MIKLNSLARWSRLSADEGIKFVGKGTGERKVRLHLNLEGVTTLYIGKGKQQSLLCTAGPGLETVEFNIAGTFTVFAEKGSGTVMYQSADLEPTHSEIVDPVIFTRIANRRHRNPELEEMMYRATQNMEARLALQASELAAAFDRRVKELENGRSQETVRSDAPGAAAKSGGEEVPAQGGSGDEPAPPAAEPAPTGAAAGAEAPAAGPAAGA